MNFDNTSGPRASVLVRGGTLPLEKAQAISKWLTDHPERVGHVEISGEDATRLTAEALVRRVDQLTRPGKRVTIYVDGKPRETPVEPGDKDEVRAALGVPHGRAVAYEAAPNDLLRFDLETFTFVEGDRFVTRGFEALLEKPLGLTVKGPDMSGLENVDVRCLMCEAEYVTARIALDNGEACCPACKSQAAVERTPEDDAEAWKGGAS